jgi:hypothetical protein
MSRLAKKVIRFSPNQLLSKCLATKIIKEDGTIEPTGRVIEMVRPDN